MNPFSRIDFQTILQPLMGGNKLCLKQVDGLNTTEEVVYGSNPIRLSTSIGIHFFNTQKEIQSELWIGQNMMDGVAQR